MSRIPHIPFSATYIVGGSESTSQFPYLNRLCHASDLTDNTRRSVFGFNAKHKFRSNRQSTDNFTWKSRTISPGSHVPYFQIHNMKILL